MWDGGVWSEMVECGMVECGVGWWSVGWWSVRQCRTVECGSIPDSGERETYGLYIHLHASLAHINYLFLKCHDVGVHDMWGYMTCGGT